MQVPPLLPRFLLLSGTLPFTAEQIKVLSSHKVRMDGKATPPEKAASCPLPATPCPEGYTYSVPLGARQPRRAVRAVLRCCVRTMTLPLPPDTVARGAAGPAWEQISGSAKDLIRKILVVNPRAAGLIDTPP